MSQIENRRAAFRAWMDRQGVNVADIARAAKVPATTLYSYLDGKSASMKGTTQDAIAQAYSVSHEELFASLATKKREIGVWGKIGARADVSPLADYETEPMYEVALPPGIDPDGEYVAFEIEGFSMPPAEPGWIVVFRKGEFALGDLINSACMIDTADGKRLFKRLRPGYEPNRYNLESWDGTPLIENVEIISALPFAGLAPGRKGR